MGIDLSTLKKRSAQDTPRILIHGPAGVGKTTLAAQFPNSAWLQTEDGLPEDVEVASFGHLTEFWQVQDAMKSLLDEEHTISSVVLDTVDALQELIYRKLCQENNWSSISEPSFGAGYEAAADCWRFLLRGLNALRTKRGMNIILIAHSDIVKFSPPGSEPYSRYVPRLHKKAVELLLDEMDAVFFVNQRAEIKKTEAGFSKTNSHAVSSGLRYIHTEERPAYMAKNRHGLPAEVMLQQGSLPEEFAKMRIAGLS